MHKIILLFSAILFLGIVSCSNDIIKEQIEAPENEERGAVQKVVEEEVTKQRIEGSKNSYVVAYYFHGKFRCYSCHKIEQYSKEAIEGFFKDELNLGKLIFKVINIEEQGNEHFIKEYQLYTKSLVISLVRNGEEVKYKNLKKVWEYLGNKQNFYDYVKDEIDNYLKGL